jgi:hypothetical protein
MPWSTWLESLASVLSVVGALLPVVEFSVLVGIGAVGSKLIAKLVLSSAKKYFRLGERMRRYDFYERSLGWVPPPADRADMALAQDSAALDALASELAPREGDYYAHSGTPSTERLFSNLAESMFWTERLMATMSNRRWWQLSLAVGAIILTLIGIALAHSSTGGPILVKGVGTVVALLVAVDVLGEASSFGRGERDARALLSALVAEMRSPAPKRDEGVRLLTEYNCLLADLPMIPDEVYSSQQSRLTKAWLAFESSLPPRFRGPSSGP